MSGRATLTTVMSSSSMNVAIEIRTRVHHFRSITRTLENRFRRLDGEVAELLANPQIEAGSGQLGEPANVLREPDLELVTRAERPDLAAVDRDVDRLAARSVADEEDVFG